MFPSPWDPGLRYRRGEGIIGTVVQTGKSAIIHGCRRAAFHQPHPRRLRESGEVSFLCVPIIALENEVVGTLSVDLPGADRANPARSVQFLEIVASMIAFDVKSRPLEGLYRSSWRRRPFLLADCLYSIFAGEHHRELACHAREVYLSIHQPTRDLSAAIGGVQGTGLCVRVPLREPALLAKPFRQGELRRTQRRTVGERSLFRPRKRSPSPAPSTPAFGRL